MEPLDLFDDDTDAYAERIIQLWGGGDTVLPTQVACTLIAEHLLANVDIQMADLRAAACTLTGEHLMANVDIQMAVTGAAACTPTGGHLLANVDIKMAVTEGGSLHPDSRAPAGQC
jgi:hypothetical protein